MNQKLNTMEVTRDPNEPKLINELLWEAIEAAAIPGMDPEYKDYVLSSKTTQMTLRWQYGRKELCLDVKLISLPSADRSAGTPYRVECSVSGSSFHFTLDEAGVVLPRMPSMVALGRQLEKLQGIRPRL